MTAYNLRSLLVAAIVLSNCITWTASRHHYTQYMHRTRHRRQGAGLYLPGSYVIPGGEGAGWGEWGEISPCSRTCGGGVASQKRICLQFGPDGRPACQGGDTKYFSCQTQDCPADAVDFRTEQCAAFDDRDFRGFRYKWIPYTKTPNPCELHCMPRGERFFYRHSDKVIDGTRCSEDSFDVCVDGVCQPVGCDMMLGSNAREDKCRECRGNGAHCHTAAGIVDKELVKGYNDLMIIPAGATTISIEEISPSTNYLALRDNNGTYFLNGHYHIDFPRSLMIAGALWNYERSQTGFASPDKLKCLGPTKEALILSIYVQEDNVGIQYEYSVPTSLAPITDRRYNWVHEEFSPCSALCGGGSQTRNVTCRSSEELEVVDEALCEQVLKPATNQTCNNDPCPPEWIEEPWSECSKRCGEGGVRRREVTCQKIILNGNPSLVADKECFDLHGPKPELFQECNTDAVCPQWFVGRWQACDKLCDEGTQKRQVVCYQKTNGRIEVLDDKECEEEKPATEQPCMLAACEGVDWIATDWKGCDSCLSTVATRQVVCASEEYRVVNDSFCSYHNRPKTEQPCDKDKLPPCEVQWYATQWSNCSVECGDGVQTRKVFCGLYEAGTVRGVDDELCADQPRYNDTKPCSVPKEDCPYQWFAGPWGKCTKDCDGGEQYRLVMCFRGNKQAGNCPLKASPIATQSCNSQPCNADELITVTVPIVDADEEDDLPFCEDEEDYPEVGLDEITTTMMMSDSTFETTYEAESSFSTDSGSGSGMGPDVDFSSSTLSDEDATSSSILVDIDYTTDNTTSDGNETSTTTEYSTVTSDGNATTSEEISGSTGTGETSGTTETEGDATAMSTTRAPPTSTPEPPSTTENTASTDDTSDNVTSSSSDTESTIVGSTEEGDNSTSTTVESTASTDDTSDNVTSSASEPESTATGTTEEGDTTAMNTTRAPPPTTENTASTDDTSDNVTSSTSDTDSTTVGSTTEADNSTKTTESTRAPPPTIKASTDGTSDTGSTSESESTTAGSTTEGDNSTKTTNEPSSTTENTGSTDTDGTESTATEISTTEGDNSTETTDEPPSTTENTASTDDTESTTLGSTTEGDNSTDTTLEGSSTSEEASSTTDSTASTDLLSTDNVTSSEADTSSTTTGTTKEEASSTTVSSASTDITADNDTSSTSESESTTAGSTTEGDTTSTKSTREPPPTTMSTGSTDDTSDTSTSSTSESESTTLGSTTEGDTTSSKSTREPPPTTMSTGSTDVTSDTSTSSTSESESTTAGSTTEGGSTTTNEPSTTESTAESVTSTASETGSTTGESSSVTATESSVTTEGSATTDVNVSTISSLGSESTTESSLSTDEGSSTTLEGSSTTESSDKTTTTSQSESTTESATSVFSTTASGMDTATTETFETTTISGGSSTREIFFTTKKMCKPRKPKCAKSKFGCCPDNKTPAEDPFDVGCRKPRTCKETPHGCCPDGVSPAHGPDGKGCPVTPCEETLFGCCLSDNKTAAQGNDQDGCPPPPPACTLSKYGCCADNETEATGPNAKGCPETETTTTMATETTPEIGETTESSEGTTVETSSTAEGSTTAESSTTVEGSTTIETTTVLARCDDSEFGCCYDNETAAPGPNGQGCPCNATEFGCCPDDVTPAQGENNKGCQGPCKESAYGCCPDNETPAHGLELEGCCLLTAFGCCPDNRKPAEGPHLEGCGCQFTTHGCCPDNVTIATGPSNEGCGCQYTAYGCCPDRHTTASGPDFEGCSCHTYQFGCCPDGVTIAIGPDQQGCHCRYSTFGCCGDEQTPAAGPDGAGCDCAASKYGCCPDGRTPAQGSKFQGCTQTIENRQAVCSLSTDPGPCHDFTAMWFYDLEYGGCSRFWYGGCEGNGNKFATQEECEDVCVRPAPKDACKLPGVKGPCDAEHIRWHYNTTLEQCIPFRYGGCLGNANNFDTQKLCQDQCEPDKTLDKCSLPIEQGPCAGNFSSWGYNSEVGKCEQFIWGGCEGNGNRFKTEIACELRCKPTPTECSEPQDVGNCTGKEALWSFSQSENRCVPFYYSGCGGNTNRFDSRDTCEQVCPSAYEPDKCTLPAETGECSDYREKWFYDTSIKRCRRFFYGGCGGNQNNFDTEAQCENSCAEVAITTTTVRPTQPAQQPQPHPQPQMDFCLFAIDEGGRCSTAAQEMRFGYDSSLGRCVTFQYLGCGGNQNNFPSEEYCTYYCHTVQDICQLPMSPGSCEGSEMVWFYDASNDACSQFSYGGCGGNENRFETREACEMRCRTGLSTDAPTKKTPITTIAPTTVKIDNRFAEDVPAECQVPSSLEECRQEGEVWYFDAERHECASHVNRASGAGCRHTGVLNSQEACERKCGAFRGVDVCTQRLDIGPCQDYVTKVYFNQETKSCEQFTYGGCLGGANRFSSVEECQDTCQARIDVCQLPHDQGECNSYVRQWYYEPSHGACFQFVYGGCGGNGNRFDTQQDCEARCKRPVTTTTLSPEIQPEPESECTTPRSLAPCDSNSTVFYYDSASKSCLVGQFGYCGHPNSYPSEEACERRCGSFVGLNVCKARLDTGTCNNPVTKYYYDAATGSCKSFAYSGCGGGPNRFSSPEECEEYCGNTGPARRCLMEVDSGYTGCDAPSVARYYYSSSRADCILFVYNGCGGNQNKFPTYDECRRFCVPSANEVGCEWYEQQCAELRCAAGARVVRVQAAGGCEQCACEDEPAACDALRQDCDAMDCPYGIKRIEENGCERCECHDDPCSAARCPPTMRCTAYAYTDPATHEPKYSAKCIQDEEPNSVDCSSAEAQCAQIQCEFSVQRVRMPDGCVRCECVQVEIDCEPLEQECEHLTCNYGMERTTGRDGCERCKCLDEPCKGQVCPEGQRCVNYAYRDIMDEVRYNAECRPVLKEGQCPVDEPAAGESSCHRECNDDADCRGVGKCCARGCSSLCVAPATPAPPAPPAQHTVTTTYAPDVPSAPRALPETEPEVTATEGGKATLRCLFHGNPPPKITWTFGQVTIDSNVGRYRLLSDGALEIVSLYRNDTGVYICIADNGLGRSTQEINLLVHDPVPAPVGIAGDENAVVTGELDRPLSVSCLAYGYPLPGIFWAFNGAMVPFNDATYEIRGNTLLIRSLSIDTLGQYTCQAYNGVGKAASWVVTVRAYRPEGIFLEHEYVVPRHSLPPTTRLLPLPTREHTTTTPSTTTTTTERPIFFTVPVSTHISTSYSSLKAGAELRLVCEVDGYPEPDVYWTKDNARIASDDRISISGSAAVSRLTISKVEISDAGMYGCHADNGYTSNADNAQISVQQSVVPPKCTDNPFFANCHLIVRSKFCNHKYYSKFCCKSCVEAGQLDPQVAEMQADQPYRKK